jgi:hypothetical protein
MRTLKLTRWLPRHTTRRLYSTTLRATSEGSMAKVGLAIANKSGLTRWQENPSPYRQGGSPYGALPNRLALRKILGLATLRPRGMKTTRPNSAARAKELRENKGVADNGLTNTNNNILPTTNDDPRWHFGDTGDVMVSIFSKFPLHYLNKEKTILIYWHANKSYIIQKEKRIRFSSSKI